MTENAMLQKIFEKYTFDELVHMYDDWERRKETGMTRSPEDIVKGLECCTNVIGCCGKCPYHDPELKGCDDNMLLKDALVLIRHLQEKLEEKHD